MIHGGIWGFEPAFLGLTVYADPSQISLPVFLAQKGVDAWGISYRWARIPVGFPDQSFMADWGMDVAVSDARIGLRIARVARLLSGQGHRGLHVLRWSRGVWTTMALANAEATEPPHRRDIAGLIPVDGSFKGDPENENWRLGNCVDFALYQDSLAAGAFGSDTSFLQLVGSPDVTSLIVRKRPPEEAALDIGHVDIFQAPASRGLFWKPILAWIRAH